MASLASSMCSFSMSSDIPAGKLPLYAAGRRRYPVLHTGVIQYAVQLQPLLIVCKEHIVPYVRHYLLLSISMNAPMRVRSCSASVSV